jgi:hypothetical protein
MPTQNEPDTSSIICNQEYRCEGNAGGVDKGVII